MKTIQIYYKLVKVLSTGYEIPNVYHKYLLYSDSEGAEYIFRGGPFEVRLWTPRLLQLNGVPPSQT